MYIQQINARNFRNYDDLQLKFDPSTPINIIVSPNGMGKSNLLEMIYYFSYVRSFRNVQDKELIKKGENFFFIEGLYTDNYLSNKISIKYHQKKSIEFNNKQLKKYSELLGKLLTVLFCNEDIFIINGAPSIRRRFFDMFLSVLDINYLHQLRTYLEIIKQKNHVLKNNQNSELLDIYNQQLSPIIFNIISKRSGFIEEINHSFKEYYQNMGLFKDKVKMIYQSSIKTKELTQDKIYKILSENSNKDIDAGCSTLGPHRDNYLFLMNGIVFSKYASFGQTRLAALIIKLIQCEFYQKKFNVKPVLLLDDVILELDKKKQAVFVNTISQYEQLFLTVTNDEFAGLFEDQALINKIRIEYGKIK